MSSLVDWMAERPAFVLFLGLAVVMLVISLLFTKLSEWAFSGDTRSRTSTSVTTLVGVVAGLYAVLIAFVIVNEWQTFDQASAYVSDEAAALASAYFDASALPEPARSDLHAALIAYDRSVVCDEIPHLAHHESPNRATRRALVAVFDTAARAAPAAASSPFYAPLIDELSKVAAARRYRVDSAASTLPDVLLVVILLTSVVLVALMSVLDTQHRRWHAVLITAVTLLVALNLALVFALDRPYDGAAKVSDTPLREGIPSALLRCAPK